MCDVNLSPMQDNEYVQAIKSVASVLAPYDSDQLIPAFGFGARLPPEGRVSHCFPLTFNEARPEVGGVQGLLDAYRFALSRVDLYGPTNFSSFLDTAIQYATGGVTQDQQAYSILLIITVSTPSHPHTHSSHLLLPFLTLSPAHPHTPALSHPPHSILSFPAILPSSHPHSFPPSHPHTLTPTVFTPSLLSSLTPSHPHSYRLHTLTPFLPHILTPSLLPSSHPHSSLTPSHPHS